jgi:hypothetical protein
MDPFEIDPNDPEPLENLIPRKIFWLAHHLHNLIYIRFFYEQIGMQPPEWTKNEMTRVQGRLLDQLDRENSQGGKFRKEIQDEARSSGDEERRVEDRAPLHQSQLRRRI